jgi:hypothetical protein
MVRDSQILFAATTDGTDKAKTRQKTAPEQLGEALIRPAVYWLFHSWRLFGYGFVVPPLLALRPLKTSLGLAAYVAIHRRLWWQRLVHRFFSYGASRRHKIVNPAAHLIREDKRYLWCLHPHSVLADGWHSIIARNVDSFEMGPPTVGRKIALCFAPIIQHVPIHQEMYRDKCGSADKKAIMKWWNTPDTDPALIPGGFAESCFASSSDSQYEYAYLKDRKGFIRICLEAGKDIVPIYTFNSTRMYYNPRVLRGWRARFSQHYYIGLVPFTGKYFTSMPLTDETTTVVFPPFEVTKYTLDQLDDAHSAYLNHLKLYFDEYKADYGMKGVELKFIGNDFKDEDIVAATLRSFGLMSKL